MEEGVGVGGDGGGVADATEGEAGYHSTCVAFHDEFEVGRVVEELHEELVTFFQWEILVRHGRGLGHDFVDKFSLATPCFCREETMKLVGRGASPRVGLEKIKLVPTIVSQKRNIFARSLAVFEIVDRRTVRVDGASLHQQVLCNLVRC